MCVSLIIIIIILFPSPYVPRALHVGAGERPYGCSLCSARFITSAALRRHVNTHMVDRPHVTCPVCQRQFAQPTYLKEHMRLHNDDRPFACGVCPMKFAYASYLERHLKTHTGRPISSRSGAFQSVGPRAGSGVVRIDSLRFLAGCRTRRLNQALSVLS